LFAEVQDFCGKVAYTTDGFLQYLEKASQASIPIGRKDYLCTCWKTVADDYLEEMNQKKDRTRRSDPDVAQHLSGVSGQHLSGVSGALCTTLNIHIAAITRAVRAEHQRAAGDTFHPQYSKRPAATRSMASIAEKE